MENFDAVWERVTSSNISESADSSDTETLRRLIDSKASAVFAYSTIMKRSRGVMMRMISDISCDEREHLKKLQTMHFIITGDTYAPAVTKPDDTGALELLRLCHATERDSVRAYKSAWGSTDNERLSEIYADISEDESSHIRMLESIIASLMD